MCKDLPKHLLYAKFAHLPRKQWAEALHMHETKSRLASAASLVLSTTPSVPISKASRRILASFADFATPNKAAGCP